MHQKCNKNALNTFQFYIDILHCIVESEGKITRGDLDGVEDYIVESEGRITGGEVMVMVEHLAVARLFWLWTTCLSGLNW